MLLIVIRAPRFRVLLLAWLAALTPPLARAAADPAPESVVPQTWQMLDYLANDYRGAVQGGRVISDSEYAEMREFADTARQRIASLPSRPDTAALHEHVDALVQSIAIKADPDLVKTQARGVADELLAAYPVASAPSRAPDVPHGAALYASQCTGCHGATGHGDGPAGASLTPTPANFTDVERADGRSLLALYEAITHGVPGTAMASFGTLSDADRWDLAFYVGGLAYPTQAAAGGAHWQSDAALRDRFADLAGLVRARPGDLSTDATSLAALAYLRAHPEALAEAPQGLALARARLKASRDMYYNGQHAEASRLALSAYLDGVEVIEPALAARDASLKARLETAMGAYRAALGGGASTAIVEARAADAQSALDAADAALESTPTTATATFLGAYTILVREGLEALLVVVAMIAFLRKTDRRAIVRYVHAGWVGALALGVVTWWLATTLVSISGAGREVTEGVSSLFAAAVLLGVGIWMHQKSVGGRWQAYLHAKLSDAVTRRSALFLFALAFIAVYREVFETILFYAALWSDGQGFAMLAGLAAGAVTLTGIAWVLLRTSRRLPIGTFFGASSWLIAILAFVLTGKGIKALQEAGWVGLSPAPLPRMEWIGVFPTWQSLSAQVAVVVIVLLAFVWNRRGAQTPVRA
jgi:high-affinity iron transporter